jgi:hypothetical protein
LCSPNSKGLATLLKINSNPLQSKKYQHKIKGHNPRVDLCPLIEQKIKNFWGFFGEVGFRVFLGKKRGNRGVWVAGGGWARWRRAGGGVSVVGGVDAEGGLGLFGF